MIENYGFFTTSLCTVGVFGTRYVREGDPLPTDLEIFQGSIERLSVPHIHSEFFIGTTLSINLRQNAQEKLDFVSFEEQSDTTHIEINAKGLAEGEYQLQLESFNTLSIA